MSIHQGEIDKIIEVERRILKAALVIQEEQNRIPGYDDLGDLDYDRLPEELSSIAQTIKEVRLVLMLNVEATEPLATEITEVTEVTEVTEKGAL